MRGPAAALRPKPISACAYSKPWAVTKHIHELEKQHGQRLLERRGARVALSEAGRLLLAEAVAASVQQLATVSLYVVVHTI